MSWQPYVNHGIAIGMASAGGIYDLQGNPWATSAGFAAKGSEILAVAAHFPDPPGLAKTGATVAGVRYAFAGGEPNREIYIRNKVSGIVFSRCATCMIVAFHDSNILPATCRCAIRKVMEYLRRGEQEATTSAREAVAEVAKAWQPYIDHAVNSGIVTEGGIFDLNGQKVATSGGFEATPSEIATVINHFAAPTGLAARGGAVIAGVRYAFADGFPNCEIYLRRDGGSDGGSGVVFCKCSTAVIVGYHDSAPAHSRPDPIPTSSQSVPIT
jgi:hypothetical protein